MLYAVGAAASHDSFFLFCHNCGRAVNATQFRAVDDVLFNSIQKLPRTKYNVMFEAIK